MFYDHTFTSDRAYLINTGRSWNHQNSPNPPNMFGAQVLHFHPENSDWVIWTGDEDCGGGENNCHSHRNIHFTRHWALVETYVRNLRMGTGCDKSLLVDPSQILRESYRDETGSQRFFQMGANPLQLVGMSNFFTSKFKIFDEVVGFTKFSEYLMIVAEVKSRLFALALGS
jgi:hypothetical protein